MTLLCDTFEIICSNPIKKIMQICREVDRAYVMSTSLPTKYLTTEDENSTI